MREVAKNGHQKYWIQALEAKYDRKGKEYGKKEFDEFLRDFQVTFSITFLLTVPPIPM